jgi:large subunit ribosomal protein L25
LSEDITLTLEKRETIGKGLKELRREGQLPAVIYDHGKESIHVMAPTAAMSKIWKAAGKHHPVNLTVDGKKYLALIKDADIEPTRNELRHIVFNAIAQDKEVEAEIPVVFEGDSEAEKQGLMILRQIDHVEVKALPKNLPDELPVSITTLVELGDKLHVSDIPVPAGVTMITEPEHAVAVVEESRAHAAAEAEEQEAAEAAAAEAEASAAEGGDAAGEAKEESSNDK